MNNVTAKIELSPQTEVNIKTSSAAIAYFFLLLLSISSLTLFSLSMFFSRTIFGLILPSAFGLQFSVKRLQFSSGTFSKIQQDNALAYTVTYTLFLLTYQYHQIYKFHFFGAFHFLLVKSELERRGG